jgi:uncharacterized repeat protein (TIGR01451 family)
MASTDAGGSARGSVPGVLLVLLLALALAPAAQAEQAGSAVRSLQSGMLDAGGSHACAIIGPGHDIRCWGDGTFGKLGYGNTSTVGATDSPGIRGPVFLGNGRSARAVSAGGDHTCAILDDFSVRCWGRNDFGQLGYGNVNPIGDNETPGSVGPVDLGAGRTARAIAAGGFHTCAVLDNGTVKCWGIGTDGRLGYGNTNTIGDNETPATVGPVDLGPGRTAVAITAGSFHTCALLDNGTVRCWGRSDVGQLGYGNVNSIGDNETPGTVGPVDVGAGRTVKAISAGDVDTCALLDNGTIRCWGSGQFGELGYGNGDNIGDTEVPGSVGPVDIGTGFTASAISGGGSHVCAVRSEGTALCWGFGNGGRLGYGDTLNIGDDELPGNRTVTVAIGRSERTITAGGNLTCSLLDDGTVRCWGVGASGQLGYGNTNSIGDDESPSSLPAPVFLGGLLAGNVADLSLTETADTPARTVGDTVTLTATLSNAGPDSATDSQVGNALPAGLAFQSATASQGNYDALTGSWTVGAVAPGTAPTLRIVARVTAPGTLTSAVEVVAAGVPDPDSTPGNHATGEDDRATATVTAKAAPVVAPPAADKTAPKVTIAGVPSSIKRSRFLKSGLTAKLTPNEASKFTVDLLGSTGKVVLSRAYNLSLVHRTLGLKAGRRTVKLKPKKSLVGKARKFSVKLQVIATDAAGNRRTVTKTVKVKSG